MRVCNQTHQEIVIDGDCPLCSALEEIDNLKREVEDLQADNNALEDKINELGIEDEEHAL